MARKIKTKTKIKIKRKIKREILLLTEKRIEKIVKEITKITEVGKVKSDQNQDKNDLDLVRKGKGAVTLKDVKNLQDTAEEETVKMMTDTKNLKEVRKIIEMIAGAGAKVRGKRVVMMKDIETEKIRKMIGNAKKTLKRVEKVHRKKINVLLKAANVRDIILHSPHHLHLHDLHLNHLDQLHLEEKIKREQVLLIIMGKN